MNVLVDTSQEDADAIHLALTAFRLAFPGVRTGQIDALIDRYDKIIDQTQ